MHQSIATIKSPEFINLQPLDINPLMSSCEIKVLYLGENRNHSYISKEVATEMAKTLRGAPIVGYYKENKEDFADHGEQMIWDDEGIKFNCLTKPYGFVAPDAQVWFKEFEDTDDFGNQIIREYLMTTGYLWTEQYEEAKLAVQGEGRPHSMELDEKSLDGHWSTNNKTGMDFFIINDAIFSKLCILGEDVEPCFEGSKISTSEVSTAFTKVDNNFKQTLFSMMQELKFALEGGQSNMDNIDNNLEPEVSDTPAAEVISEPAKDFKKEEEEKEDKKGSEENKDDNKKDDTSKDDEKDKKGASKNALEEEKDYTALETELSELKEKYALLEENYNSLVEFKKEVDNEKKDNLIKSFYMLSNEDKADVIANKEKYSLEDIEAKLSVICVRNKVNFDLDNKEKNDDNKEEEPITTFSLNNGENSVPAWISALKNTQKQREV